MATRRVAGAVPPDVSASLTMNICHISLFPSVGTCQYTVSFVVDGRFSADRNLQHHIEPSENRSIGETQRMDVDMDVSPLPPPLPPRRSRGLLALIIPTSCFFLFFPTGVATPATWRNRIFGARNLSNQCNHFLSGEGLSVNRRLFAR